MKKNCLYLFLFFLCAQFASATEYHVSKKGNDKNPGTREAPFLTINQATHYALPGDVITVHEGIYRELVSPERGGISPKCRIIYRAAPGEKVEIKGSERIRNWTSEDNGVWKVSLPIQFFGSYNPYTEVIYGDWYSGKGRIHHTGEVYLNGKSFYEVSSLDAVRNPQALPDTQDPESSLYCWYTETRDGETTIWANFHKANPNKELVEINVRPSCFYPSRPGINYITLQGFHLSQAATQWAPPTAEQVGLIGTHWSKGWIIEDNTIHDSKCSGITLGKDRATGHNVWTQNPGKDGSVHYIEVIFRALEQDWNKANIGSHIVRRNTIYNCEQTGICGSLGAIFSEISDNHIYNIWTKRQFDGPEIAGIKIHGAIDMLLTRNHIHNATMGFFMDWMCQGTRITGNLCYDNELQDIYMEVNHGPFVIDNNLLLSYQSIMSMSQGGAYLHNLIGGKIKSIRDNRFVPYHFAHSTSVHALAIIYCGDDRWYNNLFTGEEKETTSYFTQRTHFHNGSYGLSVYDNNAQHPIFTAGNLYMGVARPYRLETESVTDSTTTLQIQIEETDKGEIYLNLSLPQQLATPSTGLITSERLGKTLISGLPYEKHDGTPWIFDRDYFGIKRDPKHPQCGPIEQLSSGEKRIRVW